MLQEAGLITRRVDGTRRPCRLAPQALDDLTEYLNLLRKSMTANYARLDQLLTQITHEEEGTS